MPKLKGPLLSLNARGRLGELFSLTRRMGQNIIEKRPVPVDAKSPAQLFSRHMFSKCVALWHLLSEAERQEWESLARPRHMTGYAWFVSQCLRPNPGIYLPLQGGTMSGNIDMAKNRLLKLPVPTDIQEAATKGYADTHGMVPHEATHVAGGSDEIDSALAIAAMADLANGKMWQGDATNRPAPVDPPALGPTIVRKAADETVNNSNILQNDDHLLMALGANEVWQIDIFILCQGNTAADIQFGFSYPVGCLIKWGFVGAGKSNVVGTWGYTIETTADPIKIEDAILKKGITPFVNSGCRFSLIVINGANAGNINLQWAQDTATVGDTTVLENSCLIAHQLA
ncbi:unnamed protein product [marine sediment metagenome]|uniref:Uncharacterized protein n=1 Tax=marine sediment metagenome TaxID=412755 RepID=X1JC45_9ZZZZ